jgi:hypothetical protein
MTRRKIAYWVIPPASDAEFVANMEEVLETYEQAYDPARPVLCMDEQPIQLIGETRTPIEATPEHPKRVDYEYERLGTASIFMCAERSRVEVRRAQPEVVAWQFRRFRGTCPFSFDHSPRFRKPPSHPGRSDVPSPVGSSSISPEDLPWHPEA